jgi:putative effector of murein hydrolase LrgA (UPF0299 family)
MSSNVHLTTLTLLRNWLHQNKPLLVARIIGMAILFVLLITALVPTVSYGWTLASQNLAATIE